MSNLAASIKGFDFKGFFLRHGEKVGMGVTAFIVLACLALTNWSSAFDKSPDEVRTQAEKMDATLKSNRWPDAKRDSYVPQTADKSVAALSAPIQLSDFEHRVIFSPKLYQHRQQADEPEVVAVADLIARTGLFSTLVAVPAPEGEEAETTGGTGSGRIVKDKGAEPVAPKPTERVRGRAGANAAAAPAMSDGDRAEALTNSRLGGAGGGSGGPTAGETAKARGMRYNSVTGWVNLRKQHELLQKALHVESVAEAALFLEYMDFKVQRQRAVPGPVPFPDGPEAEATWKDVDTSVSIEILEEVDYDPDVVAPQFVNDAITSPLPTRIDREWSAAEVGHPRIPALDEQARQLEMLTTEVAAELTAGEAEEEDEGAPFRRGYRRVQKDPNQMRLRAMTIAGDPARLNAAVSRMPAARQQFFTPAPQGITHENDDYDPFGGMQRQVMPRFFGKGPAGKTRQPAPVAAPARPARREAAPMQGQFVPIATTADMLLFRYMDFDIEPGECYRYRVQVVIMNPSYEEEFVSSPEVAVGIDRTSPWSKPSAPIIVPKDIAYSLVRAMKSGRLRDGAELSVVQFDTDTGTLVYDKLRPRFGQYVADTRKTSHLRLDEQTLVDEEVTFTSKEILIDSAGAPALGTTALQDLKLNFSQLRGLVQGGGLDQAITLSRFGEIVSLDAAVNSEFQSAKKMYEEQMEEYKDLRDSEAAMARQGGFDTRMMVTVDRNSWRKKPGAFNNFNAIKRGPQTQGNAGTTGTKGPRRGRQPGQEEVKY